MGGAHKELWDRTETTRHYFLFLSILKLFFNEISIKFSSVLVVRPKQILIDKGYHSNDMISLTIPSVDSFRQALDGWETGGHGKWLGAPAFYRCPPANYLSSKEV